MPSAWPQRSCAGTRPGGCQRRSGRTEGSHSPRRRSQRIHERLLFLNASRPRATDNAFLVMPKEQYFKIAEWTWQQYKEQHEIEPMDPTSFEWHDAQRQLVNWRVGYVSFSAWFEVMLQEAVERGDETALLIQSQRASAASPTAGPASSQPSARGQPPKSTQQPPNPGRAPPD